MRVFVEEIAFDLVRQSKASGLFLQHEQESFSSPRAWLEKRKEAFVPSVSAFDWDVSFLTFRLPVLGLLDLEHSPSMFRTLNHIAGCPRLAACSWGPL